MLAAWLARVPIRLHTVAGLPLVEATGAKRILLNRVEQLTYACATRVYPNSQGLKEIIVENKFTSPKKLKILANGSSNGINTSYFNLHVITENEKHKLRQQLTIHKNDFIFIFVGRLVGDKGINELVAAFQKLQNSSPITRHSSLIFVGPLETALDPLLPETLVAIKNNKNIISVGWQQDVRPYLAISHCLAFPSYREGFPNVVMQAGAMGLPSIVTNINGCNEIIEDYKNGLIIPVKEEEELYKAMKELTENQELYQQLAQNARPMITSRYEQQVVWNALLEEYRSLEAS
jgi:glycosyltransferase involved in cell wall biosynthesis